MPAELRQRAFSRFRRGGLVADSMWGLVQEGSGLLSATLSFALLGRALGVERYGGFQSVFATIGPFVTLASAGVMLALIDHAVRRQEPLGEVARSCLSLTLILGGILSVLGITASLLIVDTRAVSPLAVAFITVGEFIVTPITLLAASTMQAGYSFASSVKIRLASSIARVVLIVALFSVHGLRLTTFVALNFFLQLAIGLFALRYVGRQARFRFTPGPFDVKILKTNIVYSVSISAYGVQNDGDKMVMAINNLTRELGLYAAGYRVVMMGLLPMSAFIDATHTRILEQVEDSRRYHFRLARRYTMILGAYSLVVTAVLLGAAPLISIFLGDAFDGSVNMTRWLAPLILFRSLAAAPMNGVLGLGHNNARTTFIVASAAVSFVMYLLMVPAFGWKGAAVATVIGEAANVVGAWTMLYVYQRRHDAELDAEELAAAVGSTGAL